MADSVRARCPVAQGAKRSELFQLVDQLKDFELPSDLEPWKPDERPSEPGRAAVVRDVVPSARGKTIAPRGAPAVASGHPPVELAMNSTRAKPAGTEHEREALFSRRITIFTLICF